MSTSRGYSLTSNTSVSICKSLGKGKALHAVAFSITRFVCPPFFLLDSTKVLEKLISAHSSLPSCGTKEKRQGNLNFPSCSPTVNVALENLAKVHLLLSPKKPAFSIANCFSTAHRFITNADETTTMAILIITRSSYAKTQPWNDLSTFQFQ